MGIFYTPIVEVYFMCRRSLVEYLANHLPEILKERLYEFVFEENKEEVAGYFDRINAWRRLKEVLDNLSVVDPACGSGAFLVGMMNVLYELYGVIYRHMVKEVRAFELKSSIVSRSLYGVDVMPWAIHAAELRVVPRLLRMYRKDKSIKSWLLSLGATRMSKMLQKYVAKMRRGEPPTTRHGVCKWLNPDIPDLRGVA